MEMLSKINNLSVAPRKVRLAVDLIRGKKISEAKTQMQFLTKGVAEIILKALKSAEANAKNNFKLKAEDLIVKNVIIGQGRTLKRFKPAAFGTGHALLKRSSNVTVILAVKAAEKKKSKKD